MVEDTERNNNNEVEERKKKMKWKKIVSQRFLVCAKEAIIHRAQPRIRTYYTYTLYTMLKALNHIKFTIANGNTTTTTTITNNVEHR